MSGDRSLATLPAIVSFAVRTTLPPRRLLAVVAAGLGAVAFGLLSRVIDESPAEAFGQIATEGILSLVVPVAALIIGDAVLGADLRSGTFHFTWLSPVATWQIALGRWIAGSLVAIVVLVPAVAVAAVVAGASDAATPLAVATACEAATYVAMFIAVGCLVQRTAVWSLVIVFLGGRLLGAALDGVGALSPQWLARQAFVAEFLGHLDDQLREGVPIGGAAVVRLAVISAVMLAIASWRMRHLRISGASD